MPQARSIPHPFKAIAVGLLGLPLLGQEAIRTFDDPFEYGNPGFALGFAVDDVGDVNADGIPDQIVGNPGDSTVASHAGAATVYSGANGAVLFVVYGVQDEQYLGHNVSGAGDLNADGTPDFLVGAVQFGKRGEGQVKAYSGLDGSVTLSWTGVADICLANKP